MSEGMEKIRKTKEMNDRDEGEEDGERQTRRVSQGEQERSEMVR